MTVGLTPEFRPVEHAYRAREKEDRTAYVPIGPASPAPSDTPPMTFPQSPGSGAPASPPPPARTTPAPSPQLPPRAGKRPTRNTPAKARAGTAAPGSCSTPRL